VDIKPGRILIFEEIREIEAASGKLVSATVTIDLLKQGFRGPRVKLAIDKNIISIKDTVRFEAIISDSDGIVFSYAWDLLGDGTYGPEYAYEKEFSPLKAKKIYLDSGNFTAIIRIKDAARKPYFDTLNIRVSQDSPIADAGNDTTVSPGDSIHLHGIGKDSIGFVASLEWRRENGEYGHSGTGDTSFISPLIAGSYQWFLRVTDDDGNQTEDTVTIVVSYRNDAYLASLKIDSLPIVLDFERSRYSYSASVDYSTDSIWIYYRTEDPNAMANIDGSAESGNEGKIKVPLEIGGNLIRVAVYAQNRNDKKDYTIYVFRHRNADANLSGLSVSQGKLEPEFSKTVQEYFLTIDDGQSSISVTPDLSDKVNGKLFVNGVARLSGDSGQALQTRIGLDTIDIKVIAQDDSTISHYKIVVSRLPSRDATLKDVSLTYGKMTPAFNSLIISYSDTVPNAISSIGMTATVAIQSSKIYLNGDSILKDGAKYDLSLKVGDNDFILKVIAENGDSGVYQVRIRRLSANSSLSALTVDHGQLTPSLIDSRLDYVDTVAGSVDSLRVGIRALDSSARAVRIRQDAVNGVSMSKRIALFDGSNIISIGVTAEDGSSSVYTLTVYRKSSDSTLGGIVPSVGTLSPSFSKHQNTYSITLANAQSEILFKAFPSHPLAHILLGGVPMDPLIGTAPLLIPPGERLFRFLVISESGDSMAYSVNVHRKSTNANLSDLSIDHGRLSPAFDSSIQNYRDTLAAGTKTFNISVKAKDAFVQSVSIQGNAFPGAVGSLSVPWTALGAPARILVTVTPEEGLPKSYSIIVSGAGYIKTFATNDDDNSAGVIPTDDGGFIAMDVVSQSQNVIKTLLVKFNPDGDTVWSKPFNSNVSGDGIIQSNNHTILAYGSSSASGSYDADAYIAEMDLNGKVIWERLYGTTTAHEDLLSATKTADGGYALAGFRSPISDDGADLFVVRINSQGDTLWSHSYETGTDEEIGLSIFQGPDGGFLVTGQNHASIPSASVRTCVASIDGTGKLNWLKSYGKGSISQGRSIGLLSDGNFVIFGDIASASTSRSDGMALILRPNGDSSNIKIINNGFSTVLRSSIPTRNGGFAVVGAYRSSAQPDSQEALLIELDASLNVTMNKIFGGSKDDYFQVIAPIDAGYLLMGSTYSYGSLFRDCLIVRTNSSGEAE
jgi:hypothetical protein